MKKQTNISHYMAVGLMLAIPLINPAAQFAAPAQITDSANEYRFTRNSGNQMAFDSQGTLHLTYWKGSDSFISGDPGLIYYRSWTLSDGWSSQQNVADAITGPSYPGARQSSLIVAPGDELHIFWHDTRHGSSTLGYANNLEIYHDHIAPGGDFSVSPDERLTTTTAVHAGDNAYVPQPALDADGRIVIAWYDFNANASIADIYLKESGTNGEFADAGIASMRMTNFADRGNAGSFVLPAIAIDTANLRHVVWLRDDTSDLYHGSATSGAASIAPSLIATGVCDFFDPPRIAAAPNGDIWIANGDEQTPGGEDIVLRRLRSGQTTFDAPINVTNSASRQYGPDIFISADGMIHLLWIDVRSGTHVYYGIVDPENGALIEEQPVTQSSSAWARPDLLIDSNGNVYAAWEEERNSTPGGDIWFAASLEPTAARHWMNYE